ncbi:hypothetical protein [Candidatus Endoriftia persephone]|jgi:hypothetical protein|uniref:Uncharacterized protein n=3 Tax=Gammaproteobacteria TaxID=1236 RepID=G2FBL3_9GAMM|nr:hypothetical protein [Candidatus Endoriftia persephone]EGV52699.1 hypothetical protein Rifp1Sym_ad00460 [endosymbiont of Riftia pachyptila (vent Ph05)]EGW55694.1 hypothetical protein TevJSym_ab00460 [endosymbiont of Tevnia jerichonana (vent Tica)]USF86317.1 hypothetical protein L0Y14_09170 [Candidatus Endoriftia persephone]
MLKGIKEILKTMGEALTYADAGEMLLAEQKAEVLARSTRFIPGIADTVQPSVVLAGDEVFGPVAVERAIALCREKNAMLDLLYVSPQGGTATIGLAEVLTRLEGEIDLDFQVTRRHGDLLVELDNHLRTRQAVHEVVLDVSEGLRSRAETYRRTEQWPRTSSRPEVVLTDDAVHV